MAASTSSTTYFPVQKRIRHIKMVSARNLSLKDILDEKDLNSLQTYFTLHAHRNAPAFYISEKIQETRNPSWRSFDFSSFVGTVDAASASVTVKVWAGIDANFFIVTEWTVTLSALTYVGNKLHKDGSIYKENTVIIGMVHGFYSSSDHVLRLTKEKDTELNSLVTDPASESSSYTLPTLMRIQTVERAIKQMDSSSTKVVHDIETHLALCAEREKRASEREKLCMRVHLLSCEASRNGKLLQQERERLAKIQQDLKDQKSSSAERFESLINNESTLGEARKSFIDVRELYIKTTAQLMMRRRHLIYELAEIYPIIQIQQTRIYTICGIRLPNSEDFAGEDEIMLESGLGYVAHVLLMMSQFLHLPLRYPIIYRGSRTKIKDHITPKLSDKDRDFPLYSKGQEKVLFNYGVYLLNKNVAQLRFYLGLPTQDLRVTLYNLKSLLELRFGVTFKDTTEHLKIVYATEPYLKQFSFGHATQTSQSADRAVNHKVEHLNPEELFKKVADYRHKSNESLNTAFLSNCSDGSDRRRSEDDLSKHSGRSGDELLFTAGNKPLKSSPVINNELIQETLGEVSNDSFLCDSDAEVAHEAHCNEIVS